MGKHDEESPDESTEPSFTPMPDPADPEPSEPFLETSSQTSSPWEPTLFTFGLALLAISPCLVWVGYIFGLAAIPYLAVHLLSIPLAYKVKDRTGWIRWPLGLVVVSVLAQIKTVAMISGDDDDDKNSVTRNAIFYAMTALWECSNAVNIFGGRVLLDRYGITSYRRAIFAVTCPTQIKFINESYPRDKFLWRSIHIACYIGAFFLLRYGLRPVIDVVENYVLLETETLVILLSCLFNIWNLPPHFYQLILIKCPIQIIYPYGSIYLSSSSRDFWSKWSRPASSLIRHMFYYPLGGKKRAWLSIPIMFLLNASSHYSVSEAIVGDRSEVGWNTVFGVLCIAAILEVLGDQILARTDSDNGRTILPRCWRIFRCIMALATLRFTAYVLLYKCFHSSLSFLIS